GHIGVRYYRVQLFGKELTSMIYTGGKYGGHMGVGAVRSLDVVIESIHLPCLALA
ncbi:565_t:CDS:2, partial [Funneliformis caledonium]